MSNQTTPISLFDQMRNIVDWYFITYTTNANLIFPKEDAQKVTKRVVIPVNVPRDSVTTIDVTDISEEERINLVRWVKEYKEYLTQQKNTFSFEDFVEHTTGKSISPKWRTFMKYGLVVHSNSNTNK